MAKPASGTSLDSGNALFTNLSLVAAMLENTGTTSADSTGNGRTLTLHAGCTWGTDASGDPCLSFNGSGTAFAQFASTLTTASSYSFAWRAKQTSAAQGAICGDTVQNHYVRFNSTTNLDTRNNTLTVTFPVTSFTTQADYLLTYDGTNAKLYKNGTLVSSTASGGTFTLGVLGEFSGGQQFNGTISYFYAWSGRALSSSDATALASNPYSIFLSPTPTAGTLSSTTTGTTTASLTIAGTTGGTSPYSNQLQSSPHGANTWSNAAGNSPQAGASATLTATGLSAATSYDFRVVVTDNASQTATSNVVTVTTNAAATNGTLTAPSPAKGGATITSGNFTYTPNGGYTGTVTPSDAAAGGTFAPTSLSYSDEATAKTFTYTPASGQAGTTATISVATSPAITNPAGVSYQVLDPNSVYVLPTRVTSAAGKALANTAQYQAFASRNVTNRAARIDANFEAGQYPLYADQAAEYAFNGTTAAADKFVALLKQSLTDYATSTDVSGAQFLARADSTTTAFTLANTPTSGFQVSLCPVLVVAVTRGGSAGGADTWGFDAAYVLQISNAQDGTANYVRTTDFNQGGNMRPDFIDWSPAGAEPAGAATYYVSAADISNAQHSPSLLGSGYTQTGGTTSLSFSTAPKGRRTVTDGVLNSTTTITSATANFTAADVGNYVYGTGIPANAKISSVTNSTTAVLSAAATATASGVSLLLPGVAIIVRYIYNDGVNPYRQTSNGIGGFANILIDSSFSARFLFYLVCGYDWTYKYSGLDSGTKTAFEALLIKWDAWLKSNSLTSVTPNQPAATNLPYLPGGNFGFQSNYATSYYAMRCAIAAALYARNASAGQILTDVVAYRTSYVQRDLRDTAGTNNTASYKGGWNIEGWGDYSPRSNSMIVIGSDILNEAGFIADISKEKAWIGEVIRCMAHSVLHPTQPPVNGNGLVGAMYPGGDFGEYPAPLPARDWVRTWQPLSSDSTAAAYAAYFVANETSTLTNDGFDVLYRDPAATATNWTGSEPTGYFANGSGLLVSRQAWDYASAIVAMECGDQGVAGHNTFSPGSVYLRRGQDELLVYATEFNASESSTDKLLHGNVVQIGAAGQNTLNQGPSHHTNFSLASTATNYAYGQCDNLGSFWTGSTNPGTESTRCLLHDKVNGYAFVYGRTTTGTGSTAKELHWYLAAAPTVTGDGWVIANGSSKLFGKTFCGSTLTTAADTPTVGGVATNRIKVNLAAVVASQRFVTVFQTAPSATVSMDSASRIASAGSKLEGAQIGHTIAMFGSVATGTADGYQIAGGDNYSFTETNAATTTHYVSNLLPNSTYSLTGAVQPNVTTDAAGVATFTSTGTGSSQTVTLAVPTSGTSRKVSMGYHSDSDARLVIGEETTLMVGALR